MADQASGAGKTYYDADANAWVTGIAPDIGDLGSRTAVTTKDLADYQSGDGSFRIPNPDGSYHMYSSQGVYMGIYTGPSTSFGQKGAQTHAYDQRYN